MNVLFIEIINQKPQLINYNFYIDRKMIDDNYSFNNGIVHVQFRCKLIRGSRQVIKNYKTQSLSKLINQCQ
jgi:hypothetical protein